MIEIEKFRNRIAVLEGLMQAKLGGRGRSLAGRFARAGRRLPKRIRRAGRILTEAEARMSHPGLARLQDTKAINAAFSEITAHLETIDPVDRRKGAVLGVLGGVVFNLILLVGGILLFLHWRGTI